MKNNIILMTDSYKITHYKQYPEKTKFIFSYLESRGGKFNSILFFGLQYLIKEHLVGKVITKEKIEYAEKFVEQHIGPGIFNKSGWEYILDKYDGHLPVEIKAVPEGSVIPVKNVLLTIENTDPNCFWLTSYLETILLQVWYPSTVATVSYEFKKMTDEFQVKTGSIDPNVRNFKVHDFGFRGTSSLESSALGSAAHLLNFLGTDTIPGIELLNKYYNPKTFPGFSIPASEHSTMTSWTKEKESEAYNNMLDIYPNSPFVAVVSDSYNIYNAVSEIWSGELKEKILARKGTLVIRPDSGDTIKVVNNILDILETKFPDQIIINDKGYKVLPSQIRIIQGDGLTYDSTKLLYKSIIDRKWSADNLNVGVGSGLLQKVNRDTQEFAIKCSQIIKGNNQIIEIFKQPIHSNFKISKKGRLDLIKSNNIYKTINRNVVNSLEKSELVTVFKNGKLLKEYSLKEIKEKIKESLNV